MSPETTATIITVVPLLLGGVSQIAAIFGKPALVESVGLFSRIWDVLAGNYAKAKNLK